MNPHHTFSAEQSLCNMGRYIPIELRVYIARDMSVNVRLPCVHSRFGFGIRLRRNPSAEQRIHIRLGSDMSMNDPPHKGFC